MTMPDRRQHPRHWPLAWKGSVVIAASTVLLLVSAITSYRLERNTAVATTDMMRTMQAQSEIQHLHMLVAEAATGVRGYLLTGRDDFLTPYRAANKQLPATVANLQATATDPEQRERLQRVLPLLQAKLASLDQLRGQRNASEGELQEHLLRSKQILDQLRAEMSAMNRREAALVAQRTEELQQATNRNLWTTMAIIPVGLAGALATLIFIIGLVRRVRLAAENAERLTLDLPLAPAPDNTDELGQLAERLHQASLLLAGRASAAQAASVAKTEFLARTSHELRTPLHAILGYAQLLAADCREPREREHAAQISSAGQHLLSLINEVLDIGSIEAGKLALENAPVALAPLVAEALALVQPMAGKRSVQLRVGLATNCTVLADRQRLLQVLLNVLSNAVKYGASGGTVGIGWHIEDNTVIIDIDDDGAGIPPSRRHRLFAPFDRLGAERSRTEGAGLGLAVSKALMQVMRGDINHSARSGGGCRFTLTLPAMLDDAAAMVSVPGAATPPAVPANAATHHALLIEDDASTRILVSTLLQRRPHWRLAVAEDAAGGAALAHETQPDLLLLGAGLSDSFVSAGGDAAGIAPILLGAATGTAGAGWQHLAKPLKVPDFYAMLDKIEQSP
ncbi:ATP-binding protein [Duganella sp. Root198D2]|uniref:hybrid sensor histidine kinase/response regulator n=1 Tax=Duganella sp. Root198D2 TaxID=1736489 RepID=UPI000A9AD27F|nr:ATP-binding protein [Duganella sp. Root198D2]